MNDKQYQKLKSAGLSDTQIYNYLKTGKVAGENIGGLQSFARTVAKPLLKVATSGIRTGQGLSDLLTGDIEGASQVTKPIDYGYFGKVSPVGGFDEQGNTNLKKFASDVVGTGLEAGSYLIGGGGAKNVASNLFKGKLMKAVGVGAIEGGIAGGLTGAGQSIQEDRGFNDLAISTAIGTGAGALLGGGLAGVGVGVGVSKLLPKSVATKTAIANQKVKEGITKGLSVSTKSVKDPLYFDKATRAFNVINKYKAPFEDDMGFLVTKKPENLIELSKAHQATKNLIFSKYDDLAKQAGDIGYFRFNVSPVTSKLDDVAGDISYSPAIRKYAKTLKGEVMELNGASPTQIQSRIQDLNQSLQTFFATRSGKAKAQIDASVAVKLREMLDNTITNLTGENYQALKNEYGALKTIEKDLGNALAKQLRKNKAGFFDLSDIFTGGDLSAGILTGNPALIAKGSVGYGIKNVLKYLNDPNRYIKNVFNALDDVTNTVNKARVNPSQKLLSAPTAIPLKPKSDTTRLLSQKEAREMITSKVNPKVSSPKLLKSGDYTKPNLAAIPLENKEIQLGKQINPVTGEKLRSGLRPGFAKVPFTGEKLVKSNKALKNEVIATLSEQNGMYKTSEKVALYEKYIKPQLNKIDDVKKDEVVVYFNGDGGKNQYVNTVPSEVWHYPVDKNLVVKKVKLSDLKSTGNKEKDAIGYRLLKKTIPLKSDHLIQEAKKTSSDIIKRVDEITPIIQDGFDKTTGTFKNSQIKDLFKERQYLLKELEKLQLEESNNLNKLRIAETKKADTKLIKLDKSIDSLKEKNISEVMNEAKKHKTFDEFYSKIRGSSTQYGEYSPNLRKYVRPESKILGDIKGLNREDYITVYRGIDAKNASGKSIRNGDFVTTDFNDALQYTDSPSKVVSLRTKLKNLISEYPDEVDITNPKNPVSYELIYNRDGEMIKITDTKLIDIWNKAHGKTKLKSGK